MVGACRTVDLTVSGGALAVVRAHGRQFGESPAGFLSPLRVVAALVALHDAGAHPASAAEGVLAKRRGTVFDDASKAGRHGGSSSLR